MIKTVLITGASTGIGRATAELFHRNGWNVVATMRDPSRTPELVTAERFLCWPLDVTRPETIAPALTAALERFGTIDVLVNNAGYGLTGPFEACTPAQLEQQMATNVLGLMAVTRQALPTLRAQGRGTIINVSSVGGRVTFPLYSAYHASKWAVEGFSESLQYELRPLNIKVKLIEPGAIKTDFYARSVVIAQQPGLTAYDDYVARVAPQIETQSQSGDEPIVTARVIYRAATDDRWRLRYPAGGNAGALLWLRKLLPDGLFRRFVGSVLER